MELTTDFVIGSANILQMSMVKQVAALKLYILNKKNRYVLWFCLRSSRQSGRNITLVDTQANAEGITHFSD